MSWGKPATSSEFQDKLAKFCKELSDDKAILELGSGHTSEIIYQNKGGSTYIALEHHPRWHNDIITKAPHLKEHVLLAEPKHHGFMGGWFYNLDGVQIDNVGLLIIDGPPGRARFPGAFMCWKYLADEYTVMADDAENENIKAAMTLWKHLETGCTFEPFGFGKNSFIVVKAKKELHVPNMA